MNNSAVTKDILVFFSFKKHRTGYYDTLLLPLKEVEKDYGLTLYQGSLKDLHIQIIDNKLFINESMTGRQLDTFSFVKLALWLKSPQQALAASTYLERHSIPFSGHEATRTLCTSKIGELVKMSDNEVPLPRTFMSSHNEILKCFKDNPPIAFPVIAKAADTFGGKMNYLVKNYHELESALKDNKDQFFVIQEYIPNDCDYRVLILGGEIKLVMKRTRSKEVDSHLNNTSVGAEGEFVPVAGLSEEVRIDALKAAELTLRSDFAGVDVMIDKNNGKHYILEVNEAPAIPTGSGPEVKIAVLMNHIRSIVYRDNKNAND